MRQRCLLAAVAVLCLPAVAGRRKGKRARGTGSGGTAIDRARGQPEAEYVPMPWESLEQIEPTDPGPAARQRLPMLGMPGDFMEARWEQASLLARRGPGMYDGLMRGFGDLEKVIAANDFELGRDAKFAMRGKVAQMSGTLDLARAQDGYGRGATLVLNALEKVWPPCRELAREVERALRVFTSVNSYFTPPGARGFDPHFDFEDVFIVQVHGTKRWRVWEPDPAVSQGALPLNDAHTLPSKSAVPTTRPNATVLRPGDVLYIPRGWPHVAEAEGGEAPSIHMTMTLHVQDFTWESLLRFIVLTGDTQSITPDAAGFEIGLGADPRLYSNSPAAAAADPALRTALRGPSRCRTRPKTVGELGKPASLELLLIVALHQASRGTPELRSVHAPAWPTDRDSARMFAELTSVWAEHVTEAAVASQLDCDDDDDSSRGVSMAAGRQVLEGAVEKTELEGLKAWVSGAYQKGFIAED